MDPLDLKIVREMGIRPYGHAPQDIGAATEAAIAKRLRIDLKTVKARVTRMEEQGFIHSYQIVPNLGLFGLRADGYLYRVVDVEAKQEALKRVEGVEGLLEIHDFMGSEACVDMTYASAEELASKLRRVSDLTGDRAPVQFYARHLPGLQRTLSRLDWRIMRALRGRANRPLADVADELGLSLKTVRRRFDRMAHEGSFFIVPMLNPARALGIVLFELLVYAAPDAPPSTSHELLASLDHNYVYHYVPSSRALGTFGVLLFADSTAQVEELRQRVRGIRGVTRVEALLFRGWADHSGWIDQRIARACEAAA